MKYSSVDADGTAVFLVAVVGSVAFFSLAMVGGA